MKLNGRPRPATRHCCFQAEHVLHLNDDADRITAEVIDVNALVIGTNSTVPKRDSCHRRRLLAWASGHIEAR